MATETRTEIDWDTFPESDGEPMAETQANAVQMVDLIFALTTLVANQGRGNVTAVGGNQLMYFNPAYGRDHVAPDVYVILDYPPRRRVGAPGSKASSPRSSSRSPRRAHRTWT